MSSKRKLPAWTRSRPKPSSAMSCSASSTPHAFTTSIRTMPWSAPTRNSSAASITSNRRHSNKDGNSPRCHRKKWTGFGTKPSNRRITTGYNARSSIIIARTFICTKNDLSRPSIPDHSGLGLYIRINQSSAG